MIAHHLRYRARAANSISEVWVRQDMRLSAGARIVYQTPGI